MATHSQIIVAKRYRDNHPLWREQMQEVTPLPPEKQAEFRTMVKQRYGVEL